MNEKKECLKQVVLNLLLMYSSMVIILWFILKGKYEAVNPDLHFRLFVNPFIFSMIMCIALWFRIQYDTLELDNQKEKMALFDSFMSQKKVKRIGFYNGNEWFKVRNKHSFVALKFIISKSDSKYLIRAPKAVLKDMFGEWVNEP